MEKEEKKVKKEKKETIKEKVEKKEVVEKKTEKKEVVEKKEKVEKKTEKKEEKNQVEKTSTNSKKSVWGVLYIYSSYNNTHLHVTDISGSETLFKITGGMSTKSDRLKPSPNVAMSMAKELSEKCHKIGINSLYVKLRSVGGHNGGRNPGPGAQAAIRILTRYGIKLGRIEDVTPIPHDGCRKKGGKRGRRN